MSTKYNPSIVTSGLVLYLDAANINSYISGSVSWFDISGNNNTGTLTNGPTFNTGSGGSIVFDGVDDYTLLSYSSTINFTNNFTISLWLYRTGTASAGVRFFISGRSGVSGYGVGTISGNLVFTKCSIVDVNSSISSTINTWEYITWIMGTDNKVKLYKNGILSYSSNDTSALISNTTYSAYISTNTNFDGTLGSYYSGNIANTQIYNRALSDSEILQNFNAQRSRFGL